MYQYKLLSIIIDSTHTPRENYNLGITFRKLIIMLTVLILGNIRINVIQING